MDLKHRLYVTSISENFQKAKMIFDFRKFMFSDNFWLQKVGEISSAGHPALQLMHSFRWQRPADLRPAAFWSENLLL